MWACSSAGRAPAVQAGGRRFEPCHVHQLLPAFRALTNWAVGQLRQIWEHLGTIRIPTDPRTVSEHFRWHECKSGARSSYANGRVALEPLAKEFLAREATSHVCAAENANQAIRAPLVERLDGVGVFADSSQPVAYPAALKKPMHRHVRHTSETLSRQEHLTQGGLTSGDGSTFPEDRSPREIVFHASS